MVPFSAFATSRWTFGSPEARALQRHPRRWTSRASPPPGHSSGEAMAAMEAHRERSSPPGIGYEWSGLSYEERHLGRERPGALRHLAARRVPLPRRALRELVDPGLGHARRPARRPRRGARRRCCAASRTTCSSRSASSPPSASRRRTPSSSSSSRRSCTSAGMGVVEAALEAARMRLRPILMTSLAFVLGVLPLAIARGAGAGGQIAIGTAVIGGMLSATVLAILFVPALLRAHRAAARTPAPPRQEPRDADADAPRRGGGGEAAPRRRGREGHRPCVGAPARAPRRPPCLAAAGCSLAPRYERPARAGRRRRSAPPPTAQAGRRRGRRRRSAGATCSATRGCRRSSRSRSSEQPRPARRRAQRRAHRARSTGSSARTLLPQVDGERQRRRASASPRICASSGKRRHRDGVHGRGGASPPSSSTSSGGCGTSPAPPSSSTSRPRRRSRSAHSALVAEVATQYLADPRARRPGRARAADARGGRSRRSRSPGAPRAAAGPPSSTSAPPSRRCRPPGSTSPSRSSSAPSAENALVLLVGQPAPGGPARRRCRSTRSRSSPTLPAGVPSEVLLRRPDILAAEHALRRREREHRRGPRRLLPVDHAHRVRRDARAPSSRQLFGVRLGRRGASSPRIDVPIFRGRRAPREPRRRRGPQVDPDRAVRAGDPGRLPRGGRRARRPARRSTSSSRRSARGSRPSSGGYELSDRRYRGGIDSYLALLTAQRDLFTAQQLLIQSRLARLANLVDLYRALGGGWRERTSTASAAGG